MSAQAVATPGAIVETALVFGCAGDSLLGVLAAPASGAAEVAFVVVVGGPQVRSGSHRQFVHLARHLAASGFACLRFDVRGMGDSSGDARDFESLSDDIGAAIDALLARSAAGTRVVLWGLCDGASAALLYLQERGDPRIAALCLLNPWVRSTQSQARAQVKHYYTGRLRQREFWTKLLSGRVAASAISGLLSSLKLALTSRPAAAAASASFQDRMAEGWSRCAGPTLLVLSGNDLTAKEFIEYSTDQPRWRTLLAADSVTTHELAQADHTFSDARSKARLADLTAAWVRDALRAIPHRSEGSHA